MDNSEKFRWIANNIDISSFYDKLPRHVKELIREAEEADREDNDPVYYNICEDIEVKTKMLIPDILSDHEWDMICEKYSLPWTD